MVDRRRKKDPKRNQLCLRLTDRQLQLLEAYTEFRAFHSEVDAIRAMIDGLEDWLARVTARSSSSADSGLRPAADTSINDAPRSDAPITRAPATSPDTSVGDFGGRPAVRLPESLEGRDA